MNTIRLMIRLAPAAGLVAAWIAATGCDEEYASGLRFDHLAHIKEHEVACGDCHGEPKNGVFARVTHEACATCHEEWIDMKKPGEKTCGVCHPGRDYTALAQSPPPEATYPAPGVYVHTDFAKSRCIDCHVDGRSRDAMRAKAHGWGLDCKNCHVDMDRNTPPPSHLQNWTRRHGEKGQREDSTCSMCHTEQSCRECHQETMPASHTTLWRTKTHGTEAAWDRERCLVCHDKDSCTACHAEVRPQSHNASWEKRHCQECHTDSASGTGCAFCHEDATADAHPNPHGANWQREHCRECHSGSPESKQCQVCHEEAAAPLSEHPNPHGPNWARQHCTSCHEGDVTGVSCSACHGKDLLGDHPNPHGANWVNNHCNNCHEDTMGVSCETCHGGNLLGTHPNPHGAGFRRSHCYSCHAGSESADDCGRCHEGAGSVLVHEDFWPPVHNRFGDRANCFDCHE